MTSRKKDLPDRVNLKISYDKETDTYFAEGLDNPEIYALAPAKDDLVSRINAAIYDVYGVSNKVAKKMGLKYKIVIVKENPIHKLLEVGGVSAAERPQTISLSSSYPSLGLYANVGE